MEELGVEEGILLVLSSKYVATVTRVARNVTTTSKLLSLLVLVGGAIYGLS